MTKWAHTSPTLDWLTLLFGSVGLVWHGLVPTCLYVNSISGEVSIQNSLSLYWLRDFPYRCLLFLNIYPISIDPYRYNFPFWLIIQSSSINRVCRDDLRKYLQYWGLHPYGILYLSCISYCYFICSPLGYVLL